MAHRNTFGRKAQRLEEQKCDIEEKRSLKVVISISLFYIKAFEGPLEWNPQWPRTPVWKRTVFGLSSLTYLLYQWLWSQQSSFTALISTFIQRLSV